MVCLRCEQVRKARRKTPGTLALEVLLWLFFLVPGLFYTLWRAANRFDVCAACGSEDLVPANSAAARRVTARKLPEPPEGPKEGP